MLSRISALRYSSPLAARIIKWGSQSVRNQDMVMSHGVGKGLKFNAFDANVGYALGTTEPDIQKVLAAILRTDDVLYDIGANVGFFTIIGSRLVGPAGKVYAFEPLPNNASAISHNAKLNDFANVTVIAKAVSNKSGSATLVLSTEPTLAKLQDSEFKNVPTGSINVETIRIDDLLDTHAIARPSVVKIDVEGVEVDVLNGMLKTLSNEAPLILCENHGRNADVSKILDACGYWQFVVEDPDKSLEDAHWSVHVLAGPPSKKHILEHVKQMMRAG